MSYNGYGHVVDSCPHNETEFTAAATRLNCTEDKFKNTWYTCVPRRDLAALAEFCYNATDKVSLFPKDYCLRIEPSGVLQSYSCGQFTEGCPSDHYRRADLYQFPACSQINTDQRCFYADPSCPNETWSHTISVEQGSVDVGVIIGSVIGVLFVLCFVLTVVFWKRRKSYSSVPVEDLELKQTDLMKSGEYEIRLKQSIWKTATSVNLPEENLQSQQRRTDMYKDLRSKIDKGDVRKLGAARMTRMTRDDRGEIVYELRPQCARSTIGQHDHNDIFIVEDDMYALKVGRCFRRK